MTAEIRTSAYKKNGHIFCGSHICPSNAWKTKLMVMIYAHMKNAEDNRSQCSNTFRPAVLTDQAGSSSSYSDDILRACAPLTLLLPSKKISCF